MSASRFRLYTEWNGELVSRRHEALHYTKPHASKRERIALFAAVILVCWIVFG